MKNLVKFMLLLFIWGCNGQVKDEIKPEENKKEEKQPVERSEVHREYDEYGNLIKYDSIYMWSYSDRQGDSIYLNLDSIMDTFKDHFELVAPFKENEYFKYFPKTDSLFMHDFFEEDYYFKNWQNHQNDMEGMMRKMDSIRNNFLKDKYPGLMESKEKVNKKI